MKINYECLPCLINQVVKVAEMTNADDKDILFRRVFTYLGDIDFNKTNPEIIGATFGMLKEHINNSDPYKETRAYYNNLFLGMLDKLEAQINSSSNPFEQAVKYAIIGNIIDFNPMHNSDMQDIMQHFQDADTTSLAINHVGKLIGDLECANMLLYLGDNCGEICLDKLLIKKIKEDNPNIIIYFGVRGKPVVNDSIEEDAYLVGIDKYARIISNGDDSLGTVLSRTGDDFNRIYQAADIVISKGQANYESLSEQVDKNIYFLLMTKCGVIAKSIGTAQKSLICKNIIA